MTGHARLLDRRRFALRFGGGDTDAALAAVDAYRNADGGYGWGLEPDLRAQESQPAGALHALEVFEDIAPVVTPRAAELCDWLESASLDDGGLPFALPLASPAATAPFWANADAAKSSLQITGAVTGVAHRVARHDRAVADHPWLARSTAFCLDSIAAHDEDWHAIELMFAFGFLDAVAGVEDSAAALLDRLAATLPPSGALHVRGGAEDEMIRALDFAPFPDSGVRRHLADGVIAADLDRLASEQRDDGGWAVDFNSYSPAAGLEWRGYATVRALTVLQADGRL